MRTVALLLLVAVLGVGCGGSDESGDLILFSSDGDGGSEVFVMNADGTQVQQLTDNDDTDYESVWSPDGSQIAFTSDRYGSDREVFVMNADGTGVYSTNQKGWPSSWGG